MDLLVSLFLFMFLGVFASVAHSQCTATNTFSCGKWKHLTDPFWTLNKDEQSSRCGGGEFELRNCHTEEAPSIYIQGQNLRVKNISMEDKTMRLSLPIKGPCVPLNEHSIQLPLLTHSFIKVLYNCSHGNDFTKFPIFQCELNEWVYWGTEIYPLPSDLVKSCKNHFHVINGATLDDTKSCNNSHELWTKLQTALQTGFELSTKPPPSPPPPPRPKTGRDDIKNILIIGFCVFGGTALIMCGFFVFYQRLRRAMCARSSYKRRNIPSDTSSITDPENMVGLYGVKFFSYDELKEATDNFSESREIGDGGFGTVYLGKLQDGRTVAVKRLYENNYKRVELFLNEVDILARLRHTNLVTLYGCTSRHSRELLLVYEYISNGTVADHLHGENAQPGKLSWQTRLTIAVETAGALKYLHASDIIHRDVKTNNILLDDNFNVKVADFGLSRLFPLHVTHVTTVPQGTPGYVDPEYRQCYQLTDKSDVYSFGVVLVELISSKPAVDITRSRHEINLSNMALNKIQNGDLHELVDPLLGFDRDSDVCRMITAVAELAFRCLQSDRDLRPSMQEVLEILISIQCGDSQLEDKAEELDNFLDEFVLLKKQPSPTFSMTAK